MTQNYKVSKIIKSKKSAIRLSNYGLFFLKESNRLLVKLVKIKIQIDNC